jgi:hypothetical protein
MEHRIEKARDEWIHKFKNKWDSQVQHIVVEKHNSLTELTKTHEAQIRDLEKERDRQIIDIQFEFSTNIKNLKTKINTEKSTINKTYALRLTQFMTSNLKQPTIYDSICSYILQLKPAIYQEQIYSDVPVGPPVVIGVGLPEVLYEEYPTKEQLHSQHITNNGYVEPNVF